MKELRIGLVLYGGVSLAVYMNGVVTEIWYALRASVARNPNRLKNNGTGDVYRHLIEELKRSHGGADLRIVVDTIAGTSAGGVNGVVLGKAIATGADAAVLNKIWIERAGIEDLTASPFKGSPWWLRILDHALAPLFSKFRSIRKTLDRTPGITWAWVRDHMYSVFTTTDPSRTPLNGDYFTEMIASTLASMQNPPAGPKLLPPGGRLDLILTCTDLYGWPRHLPVDPQLHEVLLESAHAHRMRFRYSRPPRGGATRSNGDFDDDLSLTYAARTTAGFPLAFAPVGYADTRNSFQRARSSGTVHIAKWLAARHLPEHHLVGYDADTAWMVDGGILDNKPFSAAVALIEEKPANRAVHRTLMYIEPDPALARHDSRKQRPLPREMPGLIYKLFRHEPIVADLQAVATRNRRVERLIKIAEAAERDAVRIVALNFDGGQLDPNELERLRERSNDLLRSMNNPAYPGYVTIKARRSADTFARFLSDALGYPRESKHGYFVRTIVRSIFNQQGAFDPPTLEDDGEGYRSNESQLELLKVFDIPYRLRRLRNMVRVVNEQYSQDAADSSLLDRFKGKLMQEVFALDQLHPWASEQRNAIRKSFEEILDTDDLDATIRSYAGNPSEIVSNQNWQFHELYTQFRDHFQQTMVAQGIGVRKAVADLQGLLHERTAQAYVVYPMIDAAIYPMMDSAGIGDLSTTQVLRVSPHDANALSADPMRLRGREIGAFAGFLRKEARRHDLLWGRLDGAERMIDLIVTASIGPKWTDQVEKLRSCALTDAIIAILNESGVGANRKLRRHITDLRNRLPIQPRKQVYSGL